MQDLKKEYESIVEKYIDAFCQKQEIDKNSLYWIGGNVEDIIDVNGDFFNFLEIKKDIDTNQPKDEIFKWKNENDYLNGKIINYQSYIKGLRVKDLK